MKRINDPPPDSQKSGVKCEEVIFRIHVCFYVKLKVVYIS